MEELKDIKSVVPMVDDTLVSSLLIVLLIVIIVICGYFLYRFFKKIKKPNKREQSVWFLKSFNFEDNDKNIAYLFTKHGYITVEEHFKDEFLKIVRQLEQYKYKKDIQKIDDELKEQMKDYIKVRIR